MSGSVRPVLTKKAAEEIVFTMDFTNLLKSAGNTTITSIDSTTAPGLSISGAAVSADGKSTSFRVTGGIDGTDYEIDQLVTCADTQKLEGEGLLCVRG